MSAPRRLAIARRVRRALPHAANTAGMPARPATGVGTLRGMRSPWPSCPLCASKAAAEGNPQASGAGEKHCASALAPHRRTHVVATPRVHTPSVVDDHAAYGSAESISRRTSGQRTTHTPVACCGAGGDEHHVHVLQRRHAVRLKQVGQLGVLRHASGQYRRRCRAATHRGGILGSDAADGAPVSRAAHQQPAHSGGCGSCGVSHCGAVGKWRWCRHEPRRAWPRRDGTRSSGRVRMHRCTAAQLRAYQ